MPPIDYVPRSTMTFEQLVKLGEFRRDVLIAAALLNGSGWTPHTRKRATKDRTRKKQARKQKQHLKRIKSKTELRSMVLATRRG